MLRFLVPFLVAFPVLANDIPLPEPAIVPSVYAQQDPEIASDGHDYLAVWCRDGIRGQRISADGELIGGDFKISSASTSKAGFIVRIAWVQSSYVVVYGGSYARVSATGEVLQRDVSLGVPAEYLYAISWNGTDLLLYWSEQNGPYHLVPRISLFDSNLGVIQPRIELGGSAVAPTPEGFIVLSGKTATTVLNDGTVRPATTISAVNSVVAAASDGNSILVVSSDGTIVNYTTAAVHHVNVGDNVQLTSGFLLTWTNDSGIFGERLDATGAPIDATPFQISKTPYAGNLRGASNGTSYFLVWSDGRRTPFYLAQQVWGAFVSGKTSREMPIVFSTADQFAPNAAFNGSIGLIAWGEETVDEPSRVVVTRFAGDGTILDPHGIQITPMGRPSGVATDGRDFLVVWRDPFKPHDRIRLVRAALVRADGSVAGIQTLSSEQGMSAPRVTFDGENYFVIWDDGDDGDYLRRLHGARINRQGFLIDAMPLDFGLGWNAAIAFDGASERIVYLQDQHGLVTRRITRDGFPLESSAITLDPRPSSPSYPAIACSGGTCLAVWDHGDFEVDGVMLKATGDVGAPFPIAATHVIPAGVAVVADSSGFFMTWTDWNFRDDDILGARISADGALQGFVNVAATGANEAGAAPVANFVAYSRDGRMYLRTAFETGRRRSTR